MSDEVEMAYIKKIEMNRVLLHLEALSKTLDKWGVKHEFKIDMEELRK